MKKYTNLFVGVGLCLLLVLAATTPARASGPTNLQVPIWCTDGVMFDTLYVGVNTLATYGIDSTLLAEHEVPIVPPAGPFDVRLTDPRATDTMGVGLKLDLRYAASDFQKDTFQVAFQSSTEGGPMHFSWPSGLTGLTPTGLRWLLVDAVTGGSLFSVDMSTATSFTVPLSYYLASDPSSTNPQTQVWIIKSDVARYRTFSYNDIALDLDHAGKQGLAVKAAAISDTFWTAIPQVYIAHAESAVIAFGDKVYDSTVVFTGYPTITHKLVNDHKTFYAGGAVLDSTGVSTPPETLYISGKSQAGKAMKITVTFVHQTAFGLHPKYKTKKTATLTTATVPPVNGNILLPEPNVDNAAAQMMAALYPIPHTPAISLGIIIGDSSFHIYKLKPPGSRKDSIVRWVYHPKWADVQKSLIKGSVSKAVPDTILHRGTPWFFDSLLMAKKRIVAKQKSLIPSTTLFWMGDAPPVYGDKLFAEALVLKLNIGFSQVNVENGNYNLGHLVITDPASKFLGKHVAEISAMADTLLTRDHILFDPTVTPVDMYNMLFKLNNAFRGPVDTLSWACHNVWFKGAVYVADLNWIARDPGLLPVAAPRLTASHAVPQEYALYQNYPNPFNPTTTIRFSLPQAGAVTVRVYNLLGQEVITLADHQQFDKGASQLVFDASRYASGVYFYRIFVNDNSTGALKFQQVRKMMLLK